MAENKALKFDQCAFLSAVGRPPESTAVRSNEAFNAPAGLAAMVTSSRNDD